MMSKALGGAVFAATLVATPAQAAWLEARSKHFIVYSEGREDRVRETATRLEQLDTLMRMLSGNQAPEGDQIANPVTVFVLDDLGAIRKLYGRGNSTIGGFYVPRASGSVAFTPRQTGDVNFNPEYILFHEYGHHFLLGNYAAPYPAWFREGYAEFMGTTRFSDERVDFGRPPQHRSYSLFSSNAMSARRLFTYGAKRLNYQDQEAIYGRGWLMTHYIMFNKDRAGQFNDYMRRVSNGTPAEAAAETAFGGLGKLNTALNAYLNRNSFGVRQMERAKLPIPPITVRALSPGASAMVPLRMRSVRGVYRQIAAPLFVEGKRVAAAHAGDPVVQGWLAEMAYDAGDDAAASAAADRALAADPRSQQALLYKARVKLRRATTAKGDDVAWKEARSWIVRANRLDPNDAAALQLFYASFMMAGAEPSKSAIFGLYRASELVPQDPGLRWMAARQRIIDGDVEMAKITLRPLAYDPHAPADNPAAKLVAAIEGGAKGREALAALDQQKPAAKSGNAGN